MNTPTRDRTRTRGFFIRLLAVLVPLLVSLVALEVAATGYLFLRDGRFVPVSERLAALRNTFIEDVTQAGATCRYTDTLFPHPYLAFVHHRNPPCGITYVNNVGLFGTDFPSERPADRFVVLVTGGSVAAQFAQMVPGGPRYLEDMLNDRYVSPSGRPFLVLNGGDGAWKQPQQLILFLLYGDAVDAVVTLDGFNEHYMIGSDRRFEYPANNFLVVNPLATQNYLQVVERYFLGKVVGLLERSAVFSQSSATYLLVSGLDRVIKSDRIGGGDRATTIGSLFALPSDWPRAKRVDWAIGQYRKYLRAMVAVAGELGVRTAHFIQPVPAIGKPLTEAEKAVVGKMDYRDLYRTMMDALLELNRRDIPVVSMLEIFEDETDTLYGDPVHLLRDDGGESRGYRLMAEFMAERLAEL